MKALCFKNVKINDIFIEIMCPKTCGACQPLFGLAQKCQDAKEGNCEFMKELCYKDIYLKDVLVENMCPKTCGACPKTLVTPSNYLKSIRDWKENKFMDEKQDYTNF